LLSITLPSAGSLGSDVKGTRADFRDESEFRMFILPGDIRTGCRRPEGGGSYDSCQLVRHTGHVLFSELADASERVAGTTKRTDKVATFASVFARLPPGEIGAAVAFAVGDTPVGRIGVGWSTIRDLTPAPAPEARLSVADVAAAIAQIASISGAGSVARRRDLVHDLLAAATAPEQRLLRAILGGELRQGALDGVVAAAIAKAAGVKVAEVQRGAMFAGSLPAAAHAALTGGSDALAAIELTPARPVQPMLASPAEGVADALGATGLASVEWKLDGARIQAHRSGDDVRLFTRNLNDVTDRLGGVVEVVRALPGGDLVLDGEVLGLDLDGNPRRFQDTMGDFGADRVTGDGPGCGPSSSTSCTPASRWSTSRSRSAVTC
jgi:DNA ligase-1